MAELFGIFCTVNQAGAAADGTEGPNPVVYLNLSPVAQLGWTNYWFFVAEPAKREVLAVALAAISGNRRVNATIETPQPGNSPYTVVYRMYLTA